jgi:hypothetical protein
MSRDYPPAVVVHDHSCHEVPPLMIPQPMPVIARDHPNGRPHDCVNPHQRDALGVVIVVQYPRHLYVRSERYTQPDATRPLCDVCGGTHGLATDRLIVVRHGRLWT